MLLGNSSSSNNNGEQLESGSGGGLNGGGEGSGGEGGGIQLKKGPWTAAEDAILSDYVRKHGEGNWNAVQRNTGLARCGKSCRLRWANHLRSNLKKGAFSPAEERLIVELHAQLGNKWARMAAQLPGRTDNEIKNYWNTRVKRRQRQGLPLYPPDIQPQHHQQSSNSHHSSYHSQPSTPTTPTSSFTFPITSPTPTTTSTGHHHHHHHQYQHHHSHSLQHFPHSCYSLSPTHSLPPTPPPVSPGGLQSPHQPANYPTLTLFDTTINNNTNNNNNISSAFNMTRSPPLLQNPPRFKRFHSDTRISAFAENNNNNNNNNSSIIINSSNNFQGSTSYSSPFSPFFRSPSSPSLLTSPANNNCNHTSSAFSNAASSNNMFSSLPSYSTTLPVSFSNPNTSSTMFRNPDEKDSFLTSSTLSVYNNMKPELPSNQYLSPINGNCAEILGFENEKLSVSTVGSEVLEDLLEETQAGNYGESSRRVGEDNNNDFSGFNQWSDSSSINFSSGLKPKEETGGQINMHEDISKLLNVIPSMQVPEWYTDSGEASNCQSSGVTDGNLGLEMQQLASILHVDSTTAPGSCAYDNLPGIC